MSNFSKPLRSNQHTYNLSFSKVESMTTHKYFVTISDNYKALSAFEMKQNSKGEWKIVLPAPDYILKEEGLLSSWIINERNAIV